MYKFWIRQIVISTMPFMVVALNFKNIYKKMRYGIIAGFLSLSLFCLTWGTILSSNNTQLKEDLTKQKENISFLTEEKKSLYTQIETRNKKISSLKDELRDSREYGKLTDKEKADLKKKEEKKKKEAEKKEAKKTYQAWIKTQFSAWNGECILLKKSVLKNINDPDSFKHIESGYWKQDDYKSIIVKMTFTCKNAYGGTIKNIARCELIKSGKDKAKLKGFNIITNLTQ